MDINTWNEWLSISDMLKSLDVTCSSPLMCPLCLYEFATMCDVADMSTPSVLTLPCPKSIKDKHNIQFAGFCTWLMTKLMTWLVQTHDVVHDDKLMTWLMTKPLVPVLKTLLLCVPLKERLFTVHRYCRRYSAAAASTPPVSAAATATSVAGVCW